MRRLPRMNHTPPLLQKILAIHGGTVTEDRAFCRPCGFYGPWQSTPNALATYERHVAKHHPDKVGKKPRIEKV